MEIIICNDNVEAGIRACTEASQVINKAITEKGKAYIIVATGASQFEVLQNLVSAKNINWSKVILFHLDEYIDLPETHPASFRNYIRQRFLSKLPDLTEYYLINGENKNPYDECDRLNKIISTVSIDLALAGIGENGHLAFNDPPADFQTEKPFIVVDLDNACRTQQLNEGWFQSFEEVPGRAVSMSIQQIMKSKHIICSVPERRKAEAVKNCFEKPISNQYPASILRNHTRCTVYLDYESASLLSKKQYE